MPARARCREPVFAVLLAVATLLAPVGAAARQPALRVYSIRDGLKYSQVFCVLQDRHGLIWAGTAYGVARYDGREFATLTRADGLPHDSVRAIAEDGQGAIWVLTQEGLARLDPVGPSGAPKVAPLPAALSRIRGARFLAAAEDILWVLGERLYRVRGAQVDEVPLGVPADEVVGFGPVSASQAWVCTRRAGLRVALPGPPVRLRAPPELGAAAALIERGDELLLLQKQGLSRLAGGRFVPAPEWGLPPGHNPTGLAVHESALIVLTPARGFLRLERGRPAQSFTTQEGLPSNAVQAAITDRDGLLWLATEDGLVKVFDFAVTSYPTHRPEMGPMVLAVARDRAGDLWVGHSEGVARIRGGAIELHDPGEGRPEDAGAWALLPLAEGGVLAATKQGLVHLTGTRARRFPELPVAGSSRVYSLLRTREGSIFAGTQHGVVRFRWDGGRAQPRDALPLTSAQGSPIGEARGMAEAVDGTVWIGTDGDGVLSWDGRELHRFGREAGLPSGVCRCVLPRPGGDGVWVGTDLGLYLLAKGRASPVAAVNQALGSPYVVAMTAGEGDSVWLAAPFQVVKIAGGRIVASLDDARGLVGSSTTGENCLALEPQGTLWVGMVGGVTGVDLRQRRERWPSPEVLILGARDGGGRAVFPGCLVPHPDNSVSFSYRSPTYVAEERTRFQERLAGYEAEWSAPHLNPSQRYTNLPAGSYALEVRAVAGSGETGTPASLPFSIAAAWWQTLAARVGFVLAAVASAWILVVWRTRQLRRRTQELEGRVGERTREIAESNRQLKEAQQRISHLLETAGQAQEDLAAWSRAMAADIARAVGAREIAVFRLESERATPLTHSGAPLPTEDEARQASGQGELILPGRLLLPAAGASGEVLGMLVVLGREDGAWGEAEIQLFRGFAHQLGGALEMQRVRGKLAAAETARAALRRDMEEQGIAPVAVCPVCRRCYESGAARCPAEGSELDTRHLLPYRIRGRYRLVRVLGEGGMGTVFLAEDEQLGREVAIKIIRSESFDDPAARLRFEREARAIAHIQHPGVIALHDSGTLDDGSALLIMERLRGCDLATLLARFGPGRPDQVASLLRQSGAALGAAHRSGVLHRDIKPENLFLAAPGLTAKLVDFGLAKSLATGPDVTQSGILVGTPAYMSPEQVAGLPLSERSDLYSLAAVVYESLTGHRVVSATTLGAIFSEILGALPPPLSRFLPQAPPELTDAFAAALAKDPEQRAPAVEPWAESLAALLTACPTTVAGWPKSLPESILGQPPPAIDSLPTDDVPGRRDTGPLRRA